MTTTKDQRPSLTHQLFAELSAIRQQPCLSLYQPTHRRHPNNEQDPIRFRNLVKELEASLRTSYSAAETELFLEPFESLAHDTDFWNHTLEGLAVLGAPGIFQAIRIPLSVNEFVAVADSFHTKPLRRFLQSVDRYQVLGLSLDKIRLFEGNQRALDEVVLVPGVPRTITEALGAELSEPHDTVTAHGGVGGESAPMHHGHGGKSDEADIDAERFFRAIDRAVLEHYSRPSGLPLVLAALPEHHHLFRQVSKNPFLVDDAITSNPDSVSVEELRALAWRAMEPRYHARLAALGEEYKSAKSTGLGSDDLEQIAKAAVSGKVATLLVEANRQVAGQLNSTTGLVELGEQSGLQVHDLLDDLSELVTQKGGQALVVSTEQMPTRTGLAATYRY